MTKPTHTHKTLGGRFEQIGEQMGGGVLEGQLLVIYRDIDKDVTSATTEGDWRQHWRPIAKDDCPVCLGAGHDQIKKAKHQPCGGCFGLGKVKADGETPADMWELATVAMAIIRRQQHELEQRRRVMATPEVKATLDAAMRETIAESTARQEQEWRDGKGHGPGGRRIVGD